MFVQYWPTQTQDGFREGMCVAASQCPWGTGARPPIIINAFIPNFLAWTGIVLANSLSIPPADPNTSLAVENNKDRKMHKYLLRCAV